MGASSNEDEKRIVDKSLIHYGSAILLVLAGLNVIGCDSSSKVVSSEPQSEVVSSIDSQQKLTREAEAKLTYEHSLAMQRYLNGDLTFEQNNTLFPKVTYTLTKGLGYNGIPRNEPAIKSVLNTYKQTPRGPYHFRLSSKRRDLEVAYYMRHSIDGFAENMTFRDPSSPIKVGDTYHIWYSKSWGGVPTGQAGGSQQAYQDIKGGWQRIYSWDYVSIWHATSKDGFVWQEQGMAVEPGARGSYDDRNVFTPDILVANGKYYLYYQVARSPHVYKEGPHEIAMATADSPFGPWVKSKQPVLLPSTDGGFDSLKVHDPSFIVKGGKYYMYYKGDGNYKAPIESDKPFYIGWGVAIADKPEGPFVKSPLNPVVVGGHEVVIFPYKSSVCGMVRQGPELHTLQCAEDGVNFSISSHVTDVPYAGNFFRSGHFKDIEEYPATLPTWGMGHAHRLASKEAFIIRYDIKFLQKAAH